MDKITYWIWLSLWIPTIIATLAFAKTSVSALSAASAAKDLTDPEDPEQREKLEHISDAVALAIQTLIALNIMVCGLFALRP